MNESIIFRYAESVGAQHYSTSAKLNQGVNELFLDITKSKIKYINIIIKNVISIFIFIIKNLEMIQKFDSNPNNSSNTSSNKSSSRQGRSNIQVVDDNEQEQSNNTTKSGCC